jgi:hypothetical protein
VQITDRGVRHSTTDPQFALCPLSTSVVTWQLNLKNAEKFKVDLAELPARITIVEVKRVLYRLTIKPLSAHHKEAWQCEVGLYCEGRLRLSAAYETEPLERLTLNRVN